jgi:hypothetical protein
MSVHMFEQRGFPASLGLSQVENRAVMKCCCLMKSVAQDKFDQREGRSLCGAPLFLWETQSIASVLAVLE